MVESLLQNWWYQLPGVVAPIHDKDEDPLDDAIFHIISDDICLALLSLWVTEQ